MLRQTIEKLARHFSQGYYFKINYSAIKRSDRTMPKFCSNLSFMFTEEPFINRYNLAKVCGFKAVESGFPYGLNLEEVAKTLQESGLEQILVNTYTGDVTKGELGCAAVPGKEEEFQNAFNMTVDFAKAIKAKKIHIMSGLVQNPTKANDDVFESNLRFAVDRLEKDNIIGLLEPINPYTVPNYYMNSYSKAVRLISAINSPNLRLMLDIFHLQQIDGSVSNNIKSLMTYVGHVQIAQVPNRNEPNSDGELNYRYILNLLESVGYDDWIGLEYKPATSTKAGLKWIEELGYSL